MSRFPLHPHISSPEIERIMLSIFGAENLESLNLFHQIKAIAHLLSYLNGEYRKDGQLSVARMKLLIRLAVAAELGHTAGVSPSELSEFLDVGRNTVSALLRGLEDQGLIERHLHPTDRRQFLIRLTPAGHEMIHRRAPAFAAFTADLFSVLSTEERATLLMLLDKLFDSLYEQAAALGGPCAAHAPAATEE